MSRTRKDSNQIKNTVLEVVKKNDGTFDLFLNRQLDRNNIPETWLPEQLCLRFGFCGDEMANLFCWDTSGGTARNLGVAASVLEKRRYGYQFGDALTGRDGELVFGEDDNDGHLWLYFPKLRP